MVRIFKYPVGRDDVKVTICSHSEVWAYPALGYQSVPERTWGKIGEESSIVGLCTDLADFGFVFVCHCKATGRTTMMHTLTKVDIQTIVDQMDYVANGTSLRTELVVMKGAVYSEERKRELTDDVQRRVEDDFTWLEQCINDAQTHAITNSLPLTITRPPGCLKDRCMRVDKGTGKITILLPSGISIPVSKNLRVKISEELRGNANGCSLEQQGLFCEIRQEPPAKVTFKDHQESGWENHRSRYKNPSVISTPPIPHERNSSLESQSPSKAKPVSMELVEGRQDDAGENHRSRYNNHSVVITPPIPYERNSSLEPQSPSKAKPVSVDLVKGRQDDVVIAVMGNTGTGKSSFIGLLSGDASVHIGNNLESETSNVQVVRFLDPTSGRNVTIVDTPGFNDSREDVTDTDVLRKITDFLLSVYDKERKLNGLIYLHRISDPRFDGQSRRNLRMFHNLCGTEAHQNVVVLTTFWDKVTSQKGEEREGQLKTRFFKDLAEGGARFMRHDRTIESARQVLQHILTLVPTDVQIQVEIRLEGKPLEDTAAGSVHSEEIERVIARHRKELADLKAELKKMDESNKAARRELEEERNKLRRALARWEGERVELKKGLDEARKVGGWLEMDAAKEREDYEKWSQDQDHEWNSWV